MNAEKSYSELVSKAENAVAAVKDPELRRVAFEKVLDDLLSPKGIQSNISEGKNNVANPALKPATRVSPSTPKSSGGPKKYLEELIDEQFFAKPKNMAEVKSELENRGHHIPRTSLSGPLQKLCQEKRLRRTKTEGTFSYSIW